MVGGLATSFLLELTVYPAIFAIWKGRKLRRPIVEAPTTGTGSSFLPAE
jgi:Cu(I)/Ag(I) efflux system membrane protein CusA/SilA